MIRRLSFSVEDVCDRLEDNNRLFRYDDMVFRPIEGRDIGLYDRLDDAFWREREAGFSLPDTVLAEDASGDYWAGVEYIDGARPRDTLSVHADEDVIDGFLSSYASSQRKVIENPDKPFVWDVGMHQFLKDGSDWYVIDVEPRLTYLTDRVSRANSFYLSNVAKTISQHARFTRTHHSLPETTRVLDDLVNKIACEDEESRWVDPSPIPAYGAVQRYALK